MRELVAVSNSDGMKHGKPGNNDELDELTELPNLSGVP